MGSCGSPVSVFSIGWGRDHAAAGFAVIGHAGRNWQISKKVVFRQDFDILKAISPDMWLDYLRKYRYLRKNASLLTLFVKCVYKSIKIESFQEEF